MTDRPSVATRLARPWGSPSGPVTPPIHQTSLFTFDDYAAFEARMAGETDEPLYTRVQNPTVSEFERMMADLEGGEAAVAFASGMGAISAAIMALIRPGMRVACVEHVYPDAYRLLERMMAPAGVTVEYMPVDAMTEPGALDGYDVAYLESPTSMTLDVADLGAIARVAKAAGCLTIHDNSWATPLHQRPLELGIDVVVHSASKYISGHSDTVAGVVVASASLVAKLRDLTLPMLGAKLAPFEAWLLIRGLRTLVPRMRMHEATANLFVDRLAGLRQVTRVRSPGPNVVPGITGRSGLLSIELADGVDIPRLADGLRHFRLGVSWGGFESLIVPASISLRQSGEKNAAQRFGVSPRLVRLSLGLEDAEELWTDFEGALAAATG
ncbi:aminotransferase class I/II-fold pyridoxal phosphate-dependent enzyme [Wenxinia saemankumensis]|uniref:Cystathionine beta-lyase/cystathionine gamma-synthase n=1 Tax=Wenxinia saemankumensis TaxID=1447782 RepID=A0A1M6CX12_9RHOB|nr:aminotransferase class I/II-fold pyridoxal phosphate-dependent enzyme [Wenxinia saemankumensis]SHI65526.1 Cystathionine beta-lyase/cystathionine gamma-synthase [Wenxinia saemankumensis]